MLPGFQNDSGFIKTLDMIGSDIRLAGTQAGKEVSIRRSTQALIPRHIARAEVAHIDVWRLLVHVGDQQFAGTVRPALAGQIQAALNQDIAPTGHAEHPLFRQHLVHRHGYFIGIRHGHNVAGRTLQHGHLGRFFRHRRHQRNRRGTTANHHHFLAAVVQLFRPLLRVNNLALEVLFSGEVWPVTLVIVVVPSAIHHEPAGEFTAFAAGFMLCIECPLLLIAGPVSVIQFQAVLHFVVEAELPGRFSHVLTDISALGQYLLGVPGLEVKTEAGHVGVRADTGITEQIPGATHLFPSLDNGHALIGKLAGDVASGSDTGQSGTNDHDVVVLGAHGGLLVVSIGY